MKIVKDINGLEKVVLRETGGSSVESNFKPFKPIRGGIPICFPQFLDRGPLVTHGFARIRIWCIDLDPPPFPTNTANSANVDLILKACYVDLKLWPHNFEFRLRVSLGPEGDLMLTSRIRNANSDGKLFAYHNYFSVSDISEVCVEGLEMLDYVDNLKGKERLTDQRDALTFEAEVDKTYLNTTTKIAILDHQKKRTIVLQKEGLPDAVIWNPWNKRAEPMADFIDKEHEHMLCVEAAAMSEPITLEPGSRQAT